MALLRWTPLGTAIHFGPPPVGALVGYKHAVWDVQDVVPLDLRDNERDLWVQAGMPDLDTWNGRPYRVDARFVGGAAPGDNLAAAAERIWEMTVPAAAPKNRWHLYPASRRWPMCSCCGEPMPCRAELQDRQVTRSLDAVETFMARKPGDCWACGEHINSRQRSVTYPGDNLDLPAGPAAQFHLRSACRWRAEAYELRWLAVDPRRERILTWPDCGGLLLVHADGSSECVPGTSPLGAGNTSAPNCGGHLTHNHGPMAACYAAGRWLKNMSSPAPCPRGCDPTRHGGTRTTPRPLTRTTWGQTLL